MSFPVGRGVGLCLIVVLTAITTPVMSSLVGGYSSVPVSDKGVENVVIYATAEINRRLNNIHYMKLTNIVSASSQVVSGMKYEVEFELGETQCRKPSNLSEDLSSCPFLPEEKQQNLTCKAHVWVQDWLDKMKLLDYSCSGR